MSYHFTKAGVVAAFAKLKEQVQEESAPAIVKNEICARIDDIANNPSFAGCVIVVHARGHLEIGKPRVFNGCSEWRLEVTPVVLLLAPAAPEEAGTLE